MAKYAGNMGFVVETEVSPGVWSATEIIRKVRGDIIGAGHSYDGGNRINDNITLQHRISVVGDSYLLDHFHELRWVEVRGIKWEVSGVSFSRPRLVITLGGIFNG